MYSLTEGYCHLFKLEKGIIKAKAGKKFIYGEQSNYLVEEELVRESTRHH